MRKSRTHWTWHGLTFFSTLFFIFIYAPLLVIVVYSFNANPINMMIWSGFTFDWYRTILGIADIRSSAVLSDAVYIDSTEELLNALGNSIIVAFTTTVISTVLGTSTALALARYRFRLRAFYRMLMFMPMIMPDIVLGIGLLIFFVTAGFKLGLITIIIGHCTFLGSYVFIIVQARLAGMDRSLEEASGDLGANDWVTLRRVVLPQLAPGIIGGALLAFIISMDDLVITYFIAGVDSTTLPVFIFGMLRRGVKPEINAVATLLVLFSLAVAAVGLYLRRRR
ncbi:MAG: ABC transporter permease [Proteobacteria bacterium]|nr:ABC transporter permease [Pseudomonadota bacterium]